MAEPASGGPAIPHLTPAPHQYKKLRTLAINATTAVILVQRLSDGGQFVLKRVNVDGMAGKERLDALNEVRILALLQHPNVIQYHESFLRDGFLHIVMDYASEGDLHRQIQAAVEAGGRPLPERLVLHQFCQVVLALQYVHRANVLHRDLKTQNVFLMAGGVVKLGDFGIAKLLPSQQDYARTMVGTPYYLSPEICDDQAYNSKSDIWALGCVLYEMCSFRPPFEGASLPALLARITKGQCPPLPACYSPHIHQLVDDMLKKDPLLRPSAAQLVQRDYLHRFIQQANLPGYTPAPVVDGSPAGIPPTSPAPAPAPRPTATPAAGRPAKPQSVPSPSRPTSSSSTAQWMAQKMGEILEIQGDLDSRYPDKLGRRHSGGRFNPPLPPGPRPASHPPAPSSASAPTAPPATATPAKRGPASTAPTASGADRTVAARREPPAGLGGMEASTPARTTSMPAETATPGPSVQDGARTRLKPRSKSPGSAITRSFSESHANQRASTTATTITTTTKLPPSREALVNETQARRDRRDKERQEQAELQARHRQELRNAKSRIKVDRRPGAPGTAAPDVEVFVCNLEPHSPPHSILERSASLRLPTSASAANAASVATPASSSAATVTASSTSPPSSAAASTPMSATRHRAPSAGRERRAPAEGQNTAPASGDSARGQSAAQVRETLRQQMRADREANRGRGRTDGVAVEVYLPHRRGPSEPETEEDEGVRTHYLPLGGDGSPGGVGVDGDPLLDDSPAPAPRLGLPTRHSPDRRRGPGATWAAGEDQRGRNADPAPFQPNSSGGGSHSAPSSDESPGNVSPGCPTDSDNDNDTEDDRGRQAFGGPGSSATGNPAWVSYLGRPAPLPGGPGGPTGHAPGPPPPAPRPPPAASASAALLVAEIDLDAGDTPPRGAPTSHHHPQSPGHVHATRHATSPIRDYLPHPTPADLASSPVRQMPPMSPSTPVSLQSPASIPAGFAAAYSGRPGDSPASPGEGRVALTAPEGSAMAAVWRALLQKSEHRNFAHPEALDSLLEQLQVALAPREATGAPRDLKTLAPEDRLKIRIRALQQMGEQVLGPRLFGQMYAALKRPNEPARRELLDLARQDPVLNAAVAHINQLLLCENLYFG